MSLERLEAALSALRALLEAPRRVRELEAELEAARLLLVDEQLARAVDHARAFVEEARARGEDVELPAFVRAAATLDKRP